MAMNKSDLVAAIAYKLKISLKASTVAVDGVFEAITAALARGERVEIRGFGVWIAKQHGSKNGRNPKTGEPLAVPPKRLPFFRTGRRLADRIMAAWQREQSHPDPQIRASHSAPSPQID